MISKEQLIQRAQEARMRAYVPYSKFPVGAALLTEAGDVIEGCNIENASYSLCNCAERTAFFKAISQAQQRDEKTFVALAVVADTDRPVSPCGACRQVMVEFCETSMPVYLSNLKGDIIVTTVGELIPRAFIAEDLSKKEN